MSFGTFYKYDKNENLANFINAAKIREETKAYLKNGIADETLIENGDGTFTLVVSAPGGDYKTTFTPGAEVAENFFCTSDSAKSVFTLANRATIQTITEGGNITTIKREVDPALGMKMTFSTNYSDEVAIAYFRAA